MNNPLSRKASPMIHIRAAREADVPVILAMMRELAEHHKLSYELEVTEEVLREGLFGEWRVGHALIGESVGEVVAYAIYFFSFTSFFGVPGLYLEDLCVRSKARSQGFGKAMLARVARIAVERGCRRLEWSVLDRNEQALRFYRSIGSKSMDEWTMHRLEGLALRSLADEDADSGNPAAIDRG